jgi:predicted Rossmann fold flavoprotein
VPNPNQRVVVVGGGAAGFFAAIHCAVANPHAQVLIAERTTKVLAKVKISGGGRCNVTHACFQVAEMSRHYPRGERFMKKALAQFMTTDTVRWFQERGVPLKAEADGRMFPTTDNSQTIIDCLVGEAQRQGVRLLLQHSVEAVAPGPAGFVLTIKDREPLQCDRLIIASGGSPKESGLDWLKALGHQVAPPVPSLFTFNLPANSVTALMGVTVPHVRARIAGTKLVQEGPLLVTHWGLSGPAILKLSAWGARDIHQLGYQFVAQVHWLPTHTEDTLRLFLLEAKAGLGQRQLANRNPLGLPARLWEFFLQKIGLLPEKRWADLGKADLNRLVNLLTNDSYPVEGKTTYKEEFVTCGGVALDQVDPLTMQSRVCPGLYLAGEVLDIDGITGGFNFQAAWTTGYLAGISAARPAE